MRARSKERNERSIFLYCNEQTKLFETIDERRQQTEESLRIARYRKQLVEQDMILAKREEDEVHQAKLEQSLLRKAELEEEKVKKYQLTTQIYEVLKENAFKVKEESVAVKNYLKKQCLEEKLQRFEHNISLVQTVKKERVESRAEEQIERAKSAELKKRVLEEQKKERQSWTDHLSQAKFMKALVQKRELWEEKRRSYVEANSCEKRGFVERYERVQAQEVSWTNTGGEKVGTGAVHPREE